MAERVTAEEAAIAGSTYEADYDLASATLRQCADEIHVVLAAMDNGLADCYTHSALTAIAQRMEMAARIASEAP